MRHLCTAPGDGQLSQRRLLSNSPRVQKPTTTDRYPLGRPAVWGRPLVPEDEIARKENGWWEGNGVPWRARCPRPCLVGCCLRTRPAPCRAPSSFSSHASRPLPGGQTARGLRARQTPLLPACKRPRLHPARGTQTGERQEVTGADLGHCARTRRDTLDLRNSSRSCSEK